MKDYGEGTLRKVMRRVLLASLLLGLCCGCKGKQSPVIVVITPTGGLKYWTCFGRAVMLNAEAANIHAKLDEPQSESDYTQQAQMVEDAITDHVQGIIVAPAHQSVLAWSLQKAEQSHIPVVVVGLPTTLRPNDFAAFVDWDEMEAGRLAARRLIMLLGGRGEVGMIGVSPTVERSAVIEKAFADEIARASGMKMVSVKYGLSDWARSRQALLDLLREYPNIQGIFTADEFSTHAAAYTFDHETRKRPVLIGLSEEVDELAELKVGHIDALVISNPLELGDRAMQAMQVAIASGNASTYSSQVPVHVVDGHTMANDPDVNMLLKGPY